MRCGVDERERFRSTKRVNVEVTLLDCLLGLFAEYKACDSAGR